MFFLANNEKRFILGFSAKCACTSLKKWFIDSLGPDYEPPVEGIHQIAEHHRVLSAEAARHDGYKKIAVIRYPSRR